MSEPPLFVALQAQQYHVAEVGAPPAACGAARSLLLPGWRPAAAVQAPSFQAAPRPHITCLPACLQWLCKRTGASYPRLGSKGRTALHYAARDPGAARVLRMLLEGGLFFRRGCGVWTGSGCWWAGCWHMHAARSAKLHPAGAQLLPWATPTTCVQREGRERRAGHRRY